MFWSHCMFIEFSSSATICLISGLLWLLNRIKTWLYNRMTFVFSSSLRLRLSFSFCRSFSFFSTSCARFFAFSRDLRTAMLFRSRRRRYSSVPLSRFFNECLRLWTRFLLSFWKLLKWADGIKEKRSQLVKCETLKDFEEIAGWRCWAWQEV